MRGVVDELLLDRGFAFIEAEGKRYFFNRSALLGVGFDELAPGTALELESGREPTGDRSDEHPRAVRIRLADDAVPAVDNEALPLEKLGRR